MYGDLLVVAGLGLVVLAAVVPSMRGRSESVAGWIGLVLMAAIVVGVVGQVLS